jgi:hypothetical protein
VRRAAVLVVLVLAGCGGGGAAGPPERKIDAEGLARCMIKLTGSVLGDPARMKLSAPLRAAVARGRRADGTVLPRPGGFAAFSGVGRTFAPAGFDVSEFVPAAFVFFPGADAARDHEDDADERHGNLLVVYDGRPPGGETGLVGQCLRKVGG